MPPADSPYASLLIWLEEVAAQVRRIESDAQKALYEQKDESAYRGLMRKKAETLSALREQAARPLGNLSAELATYPKARLADFSASAANALHLNSVFYMSALLYPDDHKPGEPNNLELFLEELKKRAAE